MALSKKRKRAEQEREATYTCQICFSQRIASRFPDTNPTEECDHLINTCIPCLREYLKIQVTERLFTGKINCPECDKLMQPEHIKAAATKTVAQQFTDFERRRQQNETPGWVWCLNARCKAGKVHPYLLDNKRRKSRKRAENGNEEMLFNCDKCNSKFCVNCNKLWHVGESCAQNARRTGGVHARAEAKSERTIKTISKPCPQCQVPTQRDGGCNHMTCDECSAPWCWTCGGFFDDGYGAFGAFCACANNRGPPREVAVLQHLDALPRDPVGVQTSQ